MSETVGPQDFHAYSDPRSTQSVLQLSIFHIDKNRWLKNTLRIQARLPIETSDIRHNESVATYIFGSDRSLKFELPRLIAFCLLNFLIIKQQNEQMVSFYNFDSNYVVAWHKYSY